MQTIKTINSMNPAPAKGIQSLPTPVIDDVIITEVVNAWKGDYQKLEYGTMWDSVPHGSQQGSFPEHKLVFQQVSSEDGQWVKRIWANDRVNQDSYNYAIKYSGGSQAHPIYVRTYVLPRDGYTPLPDLTPDKTYPTALLVEEEVQRNEGELDSKYIKVVRVFETLQGPEITSYRYNERGDIETVTNQQVSPETPPDPDGLLVTQSQVIKQDVSKGTKTTATVESYTTLSSKDKKSGLLGETITTDDIVDPATQPDALSETIVSSTVEQTTATKARKRTTASIGPTSLTQKSKDGKLLGDITVTESVVPPGSSADSPTGTTSGILSSEVKQIDSGKAIKTNTVLNSTPTLSGNKKSAGLLGTTTTSETIVAANSSSDDLTLNIISSQVDPIDSLRSRKITEVSSGPNTLSGGSNKNGLLGETTITESIVSSDSFPDSLSIDVLSSEITPIDSAKSKKTTVTSSGPNALYGNSEKLGLLGKTTITESIVEAGSNADAVSMSVISSEITPIDSSKSKKTTITSLGPINLSGGESKSGLLGKTTITETIVEAGSNPDNVSLKIVSSEITPIDSAKSKKTTIFSDGPTILSGRENKSGLLGSKTITESIVPFNSSPDLLSNTVLSSEITPIDSAKSKKTTITSSGPNLLSGSENKSGLLGQTSITESIVASGSSPDSLSLKIVSSEITPIDSVRSKKTTITSVGPNTLSSNKMISQFGGGIVNYVESIVSPDQTISPDFLTVSEEIDPVDSSKSIKKSIRLSGVEWPTLTQTITGDNPQERIIITRKVVSANNVIPPNTTNFIYEQEPIDKWKSIFVTKNISFLLNAQWDDTRNISYTFPALLSVKPAFFQGAFYGGTLEKLSDIKYYRPALTGLWTGRINNSYSTTRLETETFNQTIELVSFNSDVGNFSNVLTDCSAVYLDGERVFIQKSNPTLDKYLSTKEIIVGVSSIKNKYGLYKNEIIYLKTM